MGKEKELSNRVLGSNFKCPNWFISDVRGESPIWCRSHVLIRLTEPLSYRDKRCCSI